MKRETEPQTPQTDPGSSNSPPVISVANLSKEYGKIQALDNVSFEIYPGEIVGVLGPNGAGKTTCIKCILGLVEPTSGQVGIAGIDARENSRAIHTHVAAMLEGARNVYWRLTARENLRLFASVAGESPPKARHDELLTRLNLDSRADEQVRNLSRGMKQKVSLATTLARDVDVAFLDEPTLGLDVESSLELRTELSELVADRQLTVVLSSHDMDVIEELCDRVIVMSDGQVVTDDRVDALLEAFRTQQYTVTVVDPPDSGLRSVAADCCTVTDCETSDGRAELTVTIEHEDQLAALISQLAQADGRIVSVNTADPDLEDIFLDVTGGEAR